MIDTALVVSSVVSVLIIVGLYVWYGFALSRLFPKLGAEGWKGWVPVLNEVVLLQRGGVPGWSVVFYLLPIVQLYGIYLRVLALHRIGELFGKGAGITVLGLLVPPAWATLLAGSRMPEAGDYDRRVDQLMTTPRLSDPLEPPTLYASEPPAPRPAPVPQSFPSLAPSTPEPLFVPQQPPARLQAAPLIEPTPPVEAPEEPGTIFYPWAIAEPATSPAPAAEPHPRDEFITIPPPPAPAAPAPPAAPELDVDVDADDDALDRTIVVERPPFVPWRLVTDDGHVIPLRARRVLLGRKPVASTDDVAVVAVPDTTKTLSKNHARLELSTEGTWTIVDLDSTNGVVIIERDGSETLLPPGGSAPVPGRFLLGKVGMQVSSDDTETTR